MILHVYILKSLELCSESGGSQSHQSDQFQLGPADPKTGAQGTDDVEGLLTVDFQCLNCIHIFCSCHVCCISFPDSLFFWWFNLRSGSDSHVSSRNSTRFLVPRRVVFSFDSCGWLFVSWTSNSGADARTGSWHLRLFLTKTLEVSSRNAVFGYFATSHGGVFATRPVSGLRWFVDSDDVQITLVVSRLANPHCEKMRGLERP